jgi:hypothetical protein
MASWSRATVVMWKDKDGKIDFKTFRRDFHFVGRASAISRSAEDIEKSYKLEDELRAVPFVYDLTTKAGVKLEDVVMFQGGGSSGYVTAYTIDDL